MTEVLVIAVPGRQISATLIPALTFHRSDRERTRFHEVNVIAG